MNLSAHRPARKLAKISVKDRAGMRLHMLIVDTGLPKNLEYSYFSSFSQSRHCIYSTQEHLLHLRLTVRMIYLQHTAQGNMSAMRPLRGSASTPKGWEIRSLKEAEESSNGIPLQIQKQYDTNRIRSLTGSWKMR